MQNRKSKPLTLYAVFGLAYVLAALYGMSYFLQNSALGDRYVYATRFEAMLDGTARKPFVYRRLVPMLTNAISEITPQSARDAVAHWVERVKTQSQYETARKWMPWLGASFPSFDTHFKRVIGSLIIFTFLVGYMALLFMLARALYPDIYSVALFAPIIGIFAFCSFGQPNQYIYDIPCLCLAAACFLCLYQQYFRAYIFAFLFACLNKETAIFIFLFFLVWHIRQLPTRTFLLLSVCQIIVYVVTKLALTVNYGHNAGDFLEQYTQSILEHDILGQANLPKIVMLLSLSFITTFDWSRKPLFLKMALWLLPMYYLAYLLYGYPHEYRVFFDLHPPLVLLVTHTLIIGTGISASPVFAGLVKKEGST